MDFVYLCRGYLGLYRASIRFYRDYMDLYLDIV